MYKQVMVVRTDTDMRKGKIAGQVAHAAITAAHLTSVQDRTRKTPDRFNKWFYGAYQTKVVCKVANEVELETVALKAEAAGLVVSRIRDAGHTQLEPGTFTCIGIGPDKTEQIDAITGDLKLL